MYSTHEAARLTPNKLYCNAVPPPHSSAVTDRKLGTTMDHSTPQSNEQTLVHSETHDRHPQWLATEAGHHRTNTNQLQK